MIHHGSGRVNMVGKQVVESSNQRRRKWTNPILERSAAKSLVAALHVGKQRNLVVERHGVVQLRLRRCRLPVPQHVPDILLQLELGRRRALLDRDSHGLDGVRDCHGVVIGVVHVLLLVVVRHGPRFLSFVDGRLSHGCLGLGWRCLGPGHVLQEIVVVFQVFDAGAGRRERSFLVGRARVSV